MVLSHQKITKVPTILHALKEINIIKIFYRRDTFGKVTISVFAMRKFVNLKLVNLLI